MWVWSLSWEDSPEEGMAIHSGILAWRNPWIEEPGALPSIGSQESDMTEVTYNIYSTCTFNIGATSH